MKLILPLALMTPIVLALGACGGGDDEAMTGDHRTDRQEAIAELDRELDQIDQKLRHIGDRIDSAASEADAELERSLDQFAGDVEQAWRDVGM